MKKRHARCPRPFVGKVDSPICGSDRHLNCVQGAALTAHRAVIHSRALRIHPQIPTKKRHARCLFFVGWGKVDSNHRRRCQQIYSLSPLATREFPLILFARALAGCFGIISHRSGFVKSFFMEILFFCAHLRRMDRPSHPSKKRCRCPPQRPLLPAVPRIRTCTISQIRPLQFLTNSSVCAILQSADSTNKTRR